MRNKRTSVCLLLVLLILLASCTNVENLQTPGEKTTSTNQPKQIATTSPSTVEVQDGIQIGQTCSLQAEVGVRYDPTDISGAGPVFEAKKGDSFRILAVKDGYVQVESQNRKGWIPAWYFSKEASNIHMETPYEMIVAKEVPVVSAPGQKAKEPHLDLWEGKVVQIEKSFEDWVAVHIIQYDAEYGDDMWVSKSFLIPYDPAKAKEGRLAPHTTIYDERGQIKDEAWNNPAFIQAETQIEKIGPVYQIIGPGGQMGYIRVKDFTPNPFRPSTENES